jgi:hypothetical protein
MVVPSMSQALWSLSTVPNARPNPGKVHSAHSSVEGIHAWFSVSRNLFKYLFFEAYYSLFKCSFFSISFLMVIFWIAWIHNGRGTTAFEKKKLIILDGKKLYLNPVWWLLWWWLNVNFSLCKNPAKVLIRDQRRGLVSVGEMAKKHVLMGKK